MADTTIPRNAQGQTYDEWLADTLQNNKPVLPGTDLASHDMLIGADIAKGISGVRASDFGLTLPQIQKAFAPQMTEQLQQPMGKYGVIYQGMAYGARVFNIPVTLLANDEEDYNLKLHNLAGELIKPYSSEETSIIFGSDPSVMYYGHFSSLPDFEFINEGSWDSQATLVFTASDPRGFMNVESSLDGQSYSPNHVVRVDQNPWSFTPLGNGMAEPIFHFIPKSGQKLTRWGYALQKDNLQGVYYGKSTASLKNQDTKPTVFHDDMTTQATWTKIANNAAAGFEIPGGGTVTDGTMTTNVESISVDKFASDVTKYGTPKKWWGPMMISNPMTADPGEFWEMQVRLTFKRRYDRANQSLNIILLDEDGQRRARFGVRDQGNGQQAMGFLRFGKNFADETTAAKTGLGLPSFTGPKKDKENGKNTTVKLTENVRHTTYVADKIVENHTVTVYKTGNPGKKVVTSWTKTITQTYDKTTKKISKKTVTSPKVVSTTTMNGNPPLATVRTAAYPGTKTPNTSKTGALKVGSIQYWKAGEYTRTNNVVGATASKKEKYKSKTAKKTYYKNRYQLKITETNNKTNGKTVTTTVNRDYFNGSDPLNGKWGILQALSNTVKTAVNASNHKTTTTYTTKTIKLDDYNNDNVLDDIHMNAVIGYDRKLGFYANFYALDDNQNPIGGKPIASFKDPKATARDTRYRFKPGRIAVSFQKSTITEDTIDPKTKKPLKVYTNDYMSVTDIKVTKLLQAVTAADLVTLKSGQEGVIDSTNESVYVDSVVDNTKIDIRSNFPMLTGGVEQTWVFAPDISKADIVLEYRPVYQ